MTVIHLTKIHWATAISQLDARFFSHYLILKTSLVGHLGGSVS